MSQANREPNPIPSTCHADVPGLTRRVALTLAVGTAAASAATALAATKALGAAGPDPIFALIERHRQCQATLAAAETAAEKAGTDLSDAAIDTLCAPLHDAEWHVANTPPTSLAGVAALLRYAVEFKACEHDWHPDWWKELALSIARTFERTEVT